MQACRCPSDVPLSHDRLEQHEQIEIDARQVSFLQHIHECMPQHSAVPITAIKRCAGCPRVGGGLSYSREEWPCEHYSSLIRLRAASSMEYVDAEYACSIVYHMAGKLRAPRTASRP